MNQPKGVIVLFLAVLMAQVPASALELDLTGAFARASEANFQILLGREGVVSESEASRLTRSALFPQVTLDASQSRRMSPITDPVLRSFPGVPPRSYPDRFDAVLRARLALLDFRAIDDYRISRLSVDAAERQLEDTVQEILRQIAIAYYSHWRNVRRLEVIDANLKRDRLLLKIARDQKEAGVATTLDVTRAEVQVAGNELARLQQETTVLESALSLKQILNLPMEEEIVLVDSSLPTIKETYGFSEADLEAVFRTRHDVRALETELEREELSLRAARREHLPSLELTGDWGYAAESWSDDMYEQWSIGVGLSMPVFEGFRIDATKRLASASLRRKEIELRDLKTRIEADYRLRLQQMESSARQVEVARRTRDLNQREFELERIRFQEGVADNSDVVTAQTSLANAEDTVVEAEYQHILSRVNLARTRGDIRQLVQ